MATDKPQMPRSDVSRKLTFAVEKHEARRNDGMNEIVFLIEEGIENEYVANPLGASIVTQGEDCAELRRDVRDAVECDIYPARGKLMQTPLGQARVTFASFLAACGIEVSDRPHVVRQHFIRDEVLALSLDLPVSSRPSPFA